MLRDAEGTEASCGSKYNDIDRSQGYSETRNRYVVFWFFFCLPSCFILFFFQILCQILILFLFVSIHCDANSKVVDHALSLGVQKYDF